MRFLHTIKLLDGTPIAAPDGLTLGLIANLLLSSAVGPATGGVVTNPGLGYTSIPTLSAADGTSGVFAATMEAQLAIPAAAGTNYAAGDLVTTTGGTSTRQSVWNVVSSLLVSIAINAAGTGYAGGNVITLNGGAFSTPAQLTVTNTKLITLALNAAGTGYVAADTVTLAGGTAGTAGVVTVTNIKLVSAAINAAGTGYVVGEVVTLTGGTSSVKATYMVDTIGASGAVTSGHIVNGGVFTVGNAAQTQFSTTGIGSGLTLNTGVFGINAFTISNAGVYSINGTAFTQASTSGTGTGATFQTPVYGVQSVTILTPGVYTVNSAALTQATVSPAGGTGATFNTAVFGAGVVSLVDAGLYTALASNPVAQGSTTGVGSGLTLTIQSYGVANISVTTPGTGYKNGSLITGSGGGGVGFRGLVSTFVAGVAVDLLVTTAKNMPVDSNGVGTYSVQVTPNGPAIASVNSKGRNSFSVRLDPPTAARAVEASSVDILIAA